MPEADDPKTVSTESRPEDGFYGRWSRRKRRHRAGDVDSGTPPEASPAPASPAPSAVPAAQDAGHAGDVERVLTDADMPDLDAMAADADFSPFLSPGVSEGLRRRALRKLFASATFNVTDGLDDYDDDFTTFAPLGDIVTSDMRHRMEREAEEARLRAEAEEQARAGAPQDADAEAGEPEPAHARPAQDEVGQEAEHAAPGAETAPGDARAADGRGVGGAAPAPGVAEAGGTEAGVTEAGVAEAGGTAEGETAGQAAESAPRAPALARYGEAGSARDAPVPGEEDAASREEDAAPAQAPDARRDARDDG